METVGGDSVRGQNQFELGACLARLVVPSAARAGSLGQVADSGRWFATTPAHPLAVAVQKRINPEAFVQGVCPPQSPRLLPDRHPLEGVAKIVLKARRGLPRAG